MAFALRWTHRRATGQVQFSDELIDRLPRVFAALSAGEIDVPKARLIADAVGGLDDDRLAAAVADKVLDAAPRLTTAQVRARLRRLVVAADPDAAGRRAVEDSADRRVRALLDDNNLAALAGCELLQLSPGVFTWSTPARQQYVSTPDRPLIDDNALTGLPVPAGTPPDPGG